MHSIYWKHNIRLAVGVCVWVLVGLDTWTDVVHNLASRTHHPLAPAAVSLLVLAAIVVIIIVRKPKEAIVDILVGSLAPLLIVVWHIPRTLFVRNRATSFLLYAYSLINLVMHARTVLLIALVGLLGASTLMLRVQIYSVIGGVIVAAGTLYLAFRIARRSLDSDKLIGEHITWVRDALRSNPMKELLSRESTSQSRAGKQYEALLMAFTGEILYDWSQQLLRSTRRYSHVLIIVLHLVSAYVLTLIGLAAMHLGIHDTWPHYYAVGGSTDYWHFLAYTFLSVFNTPGSGIVAAAILPGILQVIAILVLGTSTVFALFGVVETVRGRYESRVKEVAKDLAKDHHRFESMFKKRFDSTMRGYINELKGASTTSTFVLLLIDVVEAMLYAPPPLNRSARRRHR